jgi:hypothetical protein
MKGSFGVPFDLAEGYALEFPEGIHLAFIKRDVHRFIVAGVERSQQSDLYRISQGGNQREIRYSWGYPGGEALPETFSLAQQQSYQLDMQHRTLNRLDALPGQLPYTGQFGERLAFNPDALNTEYRIGGYTFTYLDRQEVQGRTFYTFGVLAFRLPLVFSPDNRFQLPPIDAATANSRLSASDPWYQLELDATSLSIAPINGK